MEQSISKFMGIAITAIVIIALIFSVGADMVETEVGTYKTSIESTSTPPTQTAGSISNP